MVNGPGPGGRGNHTTIMVGSKLFVFGGQIGGKTVNDMWTLNLNSCAIAHRCSEPILTRYFRSKIATSLGVI